LERLGRGHEARRPCLPARLRRRLGRQTGADSRAAPHTSRVTVPMQVKSNAVQVPSGICIGCFNAQQQFRFPFLLYCEHHAVLAVAYSRTEHVSFPCDPAQLPEMVEKLRKGELADRPYPAP